MLQDVISFSDMYILKNDNLYIQVDCYIRLCYLILIIGMPR